MVPTPTEHKLTIEDLNGRAKRRYAKKNTGLENVSVFLNIVTTA